MNGIMASFLVCVLVLATACAQTETRSPDAAAPAVTTQAAGAATAFNARCPISGEAVDPSIATVSFRGKTVGFCCPKCKAKFSAMSDDQKLAALAEHGSPLPK